MEIISAFGGRKDKGGKKFDGAVKRGLISMNWYLKSSNGTKCNL